eukprot:Platyproteum_vivax@DN2400_c0_g1_i1.p1
MAPPNPNRSPPPTDYYYYYCYNIIIMAEANQLQMQMQAAAAAQGDRGNYQKMNMGMDQASSAQQAAMSAAAQYQQQVLQAQQAPQLAAAASYYLAPPSAYSQQGGVPYAASYAGLSQGAMYPQGGIWLGQSAYTPNDASQLAAAEAAANQAAYAYPQQYMPIGASFYMPAGTGMPYMDPYGVMNSAALPPLLPPQPKKQPKKKSRNCC